MKQKYGPEIEGDTKTKHFIIFYAGEPMGYVQTYRITDYPDWNKFVQTGEEAAGLDFFIGDSKFRGRGLGSEIIFECLKQIIFEDPSISTVVSGPDPLNIISRRALEKAGFKYWKTIHPPEGNEYLMKVERT